MTQNLVNFLAQNLEPRHYLLNLSRRNLGCDQPMTTLTFPSPRLPAIFAALVVSSCLADPWSALVAGLCAAAGDRALGATGALGAWFHTDPTADAIPAQLVALRHDHSALVAPHPIHGRIDGGDYETIFRTPHGVDLAGLDGLAGVRVTVVGDEADLAATLQAATATTEPGVDLVIARIDPDHDMALRGQVRAAVGEAIGA